MNVPNSRGHLSFDALWAFLFEANPESDGITTVFHFRAGNGARSVLQPQMGVIRQRLPTVQQVSPLSPPSDDKLVVHTTSSQALCKLFELLSEWFSKPDGCHMDARIVTYTPNAIGGTWVPQLCVEVNGGAERRPESYNAAEEFAQLAKAYIPHPNPRKISTDHRTRTVLVVYDSENHWVHFSLVV